MSSLATHPLASSLLTQHDIYLFNEGSHFRLYEKLGAHLCEHDGVAGCHFAVWAPSARAVSVIGDFNDWDSSRHPLSPREQSGIWEGFVPRIRQGMRYKFAVTGPHGPVPDKI